MARGLKPRVEPAIEAALQKKSNLSDLDLAKLCFCARRSAARVLFDMHRFELVHISGYESVPANRQWRPLWSWGEGEDMPRPQEAAPATERMRKYREKMSADDKDFGLARRRQKRRVVKRDPLVAAFFGGIV